MEGPGYGGCGEAVGCVGGVSVHVRAALVVSGRGEALWRAGKRGGVLRLRDVTLGSGVGYGCVGSVKRQKTERRMGTWSDGGIYSAQATVGEGGSDRGVVLDGLVATAGVGRRRYVVGARWHEGTMGQMARQMGSPALQWRFGDG